MGICAVVAAFPEDQRGKSYHAFALPVVQGDTKVQNGALRSTTMPSILLLKELWPCLNYIATNYASHQVSSARFARIILIQF